MADRFGSGWRPMGGWCCVAGLAYSLILQPLLPWLAAIIGGHPIVPLPPLPSDIQNMLIMTMLGLGGMRTAERIKGADK